MKNTFRLLFILLALLLIWYLAADRNTPFTSNARVKAIATPIVPQVSGLVTSIEVANGQTVDPGTVLARIDPRPFDLERVRAEAELESALQGIGANSAEVAAAQATLSRATADLENMRLQTARVFELERKGLVPVARADDARSKLTETESMLAVARADLEKAQERLGPEGKDNPEVRKALVALGSADLNLEWTEIAAPSRGGVSNLSIATGAYAKAGQTLMTFIDAEDVWIEAYMTENNLGNMKVGDRVEVALDVHPGRVFEGLVESFAGAVTISGQSSGSDLASPPKTSGWMRDPQRFPVRIVLPGYEVGSSEDDVHFQLNGQAEVIVYTGDNTILNTLGGVYIRMMTWLSYAY